MKFRNRSRLEIKCKEFCQFLDSERTGSHGDAVEKPSGKFPVCVFNFLQDPFIRSIERRWQFVQSMPNTPWEAVAEVVQLTIYPSKPTAEVRVRVVNKQSNIDLHPIRPFYQDVNDELLVLRLPSLHFSICVNHRLDVVFDVLLLSALIVYRNRTES